MTPQTLQAVREALEMDGQCSLCGKWCKGCLDCDCDIAERPHYEPLSLDDFKARILTLLTTPQPAPDLQAVREAVEAQRPAIKTDLRQLLAEANAALETYEAQDSRDLDWRYEGGEDDAKAVATHLARLFLTLRTIVSDDDLEALVSRAQPTPQAAQEEVVERAVQPDERTVPDKLLMEIGAILDDYPVYKQLQKIRDAIAPYLASDALRAALVRIRDMKTVDGEAIEMHREELRAVARTALSCAPKDGQSTPPSQRAAPKQEGE